MTGSSGFKIATMEVTILFVYLCHGYIYDIILPKSLLVLKLAPRENKF